MVKKRYRYKQSVDEERNYPPHLLGWLEWSAGIVVMFIIVALFLFVMVLWPIIALIGMGGW